MSLQQKVLKLKLDAAIALRHASFWEKAIATHGKTKATAFYSSLGLNHLPRKSFDYEGIVLSREPKEHEKIAIKGVHAAQESAKESLTKILLGTREQLISAGLKGIQKLSAQSYHELTLSVSPENRQSLRDRLIKVYKQGRKLVVAELNNKGLNGKFQPRSIKEIDDLDEFDDLDTLTDLTDTRISNDVASRITAAATRFALLGLVGKALWDAVQKEVSEGSTGYVGRAAGGVANRTVGLGRLDEMKSRAEDIDRYEQSEILDQNTCFVCAEDDGKTADDPDDLPGAPNPDCAGSDLCRGFIVAILL